jgi:hypothetical protein
MTSPQRAKKQALLKTMSYPNARNMLIPLTILFLAALACTTLPRTTPQDSPVLTAPLPDANPSLVEPDQISPTPTDTTSPAESQPDPGTDGQQDLSETIVAGDPVPTATLSPPDQNISEMEVERPYCNSEEINPIGESIAIAYQTTYEEVMGFYCDGHEFDQILLALETREQSEITAESILLMRDEGLSWTQIWKELGIID